MHSGHTETSGYPSTTFVVARVISKFPLVDMLISVPANWLEQSASFKTHEVIGHFVGSEFENKSTAAEATLFEPSKATDFEKVVAAVDRDERHGEGSCLITKFGIWIF